MLGSCSLMSNAQSFDPSNVPPLPDYSRPDAWLAFPGRPGLEHAAPTGEAPVNDHLARVDVFFIHPTTVMGGGITNARYDAVAPFNAAVLVQQVSVFNSCCRLFAPQYRQATLRALNDDQAVELAYSDVLRAFRYYIAHENHGRPFIIASHSQGTTHAVRLLQEAILGTPLQSRMVAAYLIGGYVPDNFGDLGLPTCDSATQTGCVLSYNTSQTGRSGARFLIDSKTYWWRGENTPRAQQPAICVNPLTWNESGSAPAAANPGSLPLLRRPVEQKPGPLDLAANLTGAVCRNGLLEVDIPASSPPGFHDRLSVLTGSYHLNDYGIFYESLRRNARQRADAWLASRHKP
ncbi:DUF3089 domain-containing protein [Paraburkholderia sp.]|uniref:DUF3089 domain-containing protein n=1 Tax=Paraburkholderia sp. TaxID=1926495 RepID=UPI00238365CF|nr:DUF3089 domain-containing protein [Paraburkholderia sp.]MDE1179073.1 DUF3089 domain-containing protein [Paraburkholderia sp.]